MCGEGRQTRIERRSATARTSRPPTTGRRTPAATPVGADDTRSRPRSRVAAPSWAIAFLGRGRPEWTITEQQALARVGAIQQASAGLGTGE